MANIPADKLQIGRALLAGGPITQEMLQQELDQAGKSGSVLGKALLQSGFPKEAEVVYPLLARLRIPRINAKNTKIPLETVAIVPEEVARRARVLALDQVGRLLIVVTPDVGNEAGMQEVRQTTGLLVSPIQADPKSCTVQEFDAILGRYYQRLNESGIAPKAPGAQAPVGVGGAAGNGAVVTAIPAGEDGQDFFYRSFMSKGPVPAKEVLM